jgi:predicted enzyme related to lactoylglutathione lyase
MAKSAAKSATKPATKKAEPQSQQGMPPWSHGVFYWNELMTHDLEKAKAFYGNSVGWTFDAMPMPDGTYWIIKAGDRGVGGIFEMKGDHFKGMPEVWVPYVAVDNVDTCVEAAVKAGGTVMRPPFDVPGVGRMSIMHDAGKAIVAYMTPAG